MRKRTRRLLAIAGLAPILVLILGGMAQAQDDQNVVRGYLFYSPTCAACHNIRETILPALYKQYRQQLQITAIDINAAEENHKWLQECEREYGVPKDGSEIPALFIGDDYLVGASNIAAQLPGLVRDYLERGGTDFPDIPRPDGPLAPTARFMFFYSPTCPHCQQVEEEVFPRIRAKYGDRVQWEAYDRSDEPNLRALLMLGELSGLPQESQGAVPLIFIGDQFSLYTVLLGSGQIEAYLEQTIDWFMAVGGVDLPDWSGELFEVVAAPLPEPTDQATPSATLSPPAPVEGPPIHMAYFAEAGCSACGRVSALLDQVQKTFPSLVVYEFDIIDDLATNLCLSGILGVPPDKQHDAPAVFVGSDYLVAEEIQYDALLGLVSKYVETGAEQTWVECQDAPVESPRLPPWGVIISSGLLDGINPCAFATIVFFVSYLSFIERRGRDIVIVGLAFTLAVFLSYLGFGMLLRQVLSGLFAWVGPVLRPILNISMAVFCLVLAFLSFGDYRKARRGRTTDMVLRLPDRLRRWVNATIRRGMRSEGLGRLVTASFVSGAVVSFIELTCTGQVYAPIILGLSDPGYRAQAALALVVYCLFFVVPLVIVFVMSYMGTSSRQLGNVLQRHTASVKLVTAVLFLGIGLWLIYEVLRNWGLVTALTAMASS